MAELENNEHLLIMTSQNFGGLLWFLLPLNIHKPLVRNAILLKRVTGVLEVIVLIVLNL